jgi:cellobiose phosphorylase
MASAKAGNAASVMESIAAVYRPAALFLTNKENFVASNGDFAGTQINSSNMLWSLSGSLALVHKVLFGIEFKSDRLVFQPFVPKELEGMRRLTNFKYKNLVLDRVARFWQPD